MACLGVWNANRSPLFTINEERKILTRRPISKRQIIVLPMAKRLTPANALLESSVEDLTNYAIGIAKGFYLRAKCSMQTEYFF